MKPVSPRTAVIASVTAALAPSASAWADTGQFGPLARATGQITRADASADWTHGSIAGSVEGLSPPTHHVSSAKAYVVPNGDGCSGPAQPVWTAVATYERQSLTFDIPDVPLTSGIAPRLCLVGVYEYIFAAWPGPSGYQSKLLASRLFTVTPPATPPTKEPESQAALSRETAVSKAKSALRKRFGKAYRRGKRKRLRCNKQSSTRYVCTFSFRYRERRRHGTVMVDMKPNGRVTTKTTLGRAG
jgi:hypothetical protein